MLPAEACFLFLQNQLIYYTYIIYYYVISIESQGRMTESNAAYTD